MLCLRFLNVRDVHGWRSALVKGFGRRPGRRRTTGICAIETWGERLEIDVERSLEIATGTSP
jgi:hypothetical protein